MSDLDEKKIKTLKMCAQAGTQLQALKKSMKKSMKKVSHILYIVYIYRNKYVYKL